MKDYQTAKYNVDQFLRKEEEERQAEKIRSLFAETKKIVSIAR